MLTGNEDNRQVERRSIKLIKKSEIEKYFSMSEAIESMAAAFKSLSGGDCFVPNRYIISSGDNALTFLLKPAFMESRNKSSIKILTQKNKKTIPGIPTILGIVLLIDNITGEILSIMDGEYITALRTGAASGLATKYLSREDSKTAAIFGCGRQGRTQLEAVANVRNLEKIWIFDKSKENAESFIEEMKIKIQADFEIAFNTDVLQDADIICTATYSKSPLFSKNHLKNGVHINAVGSFKPEMQELDPQIIRSSLVYFDNKEDCINESGDIIKAIDDRQNLPLNIKGEIGELLLKRMEGRTSPEDITVFKSVGTAIQDFVVADEIYNKSVREKFGAEIKLYE